MSGLDALATFGCDKVVVIHEEQEDKSAGELTVTKHPAQATEDNGKLASGSKRNNKQGDNDQEDNQAEEPMKKDRNQAKQTGF